MEADFGNWTFGVLSAQVGVIVWCHWETMLLMTKIDHLFSWCGPSPTVACPGWKSSHWFHTSSLSAS